MASVNMMVFMGLQVIHKHRPKCVYKQGFVFNIKSTMHSNIEKNL